MAADSVVPMTGEEVVDRLIGAAQCAVKFGGSTADLIQYRTEIIDRIDPPHTVVAGKPMNSELLDRFLLHLAHSEYRKDARVSLEFDASGTDSSIVVRIKLADETQMNLFQQWLNNGILNEFRQYFPTLIEPIPVLP